MTPFAIRPHLMRRFTCSVWWCILLASMSPTYAQPIQVDWRSTLMLHFDPAERASEAERAVDAEPAADSERAVDAEPAVDAQRAAEPERAGPYLARIADGLDAGWFAEMGVGAIAVGPLFARSQERVDYGTIDPSLGGAEDWVRLISAARQKNVVVAVRLTLHSSSEDHAKLAEWAAETGVRHFILRGPAIADVAALRRALDAASGESSWIAASSETTGAAGGVGAEAGTLSENGTPDGRNNRIEAGLFDALIETSSIEDLGNDTSLEAAYTSIGRRSSTSIRPLITSISIPAEAAGPLAARVLMLPGALHVTTSAIPDELTDLWRRIAAFRARHPAVSSGEHVALVNSAFTFARILSDSRVEDRVIVVLGASDDTTINVARIFPDNTLLQDALTGRTAFVSFGMAAFQPGASGVILIEEAR